MTAPLRNENPWIAISLVVGLSVTGACGSAPAVEETSLALCAEANQDFELGIGVEDFAEVMEGQELWFIPGIQGGFHIWGAIRAGAVDPVDTVMTFELFQEEQLLGGRILPQDLRCNGETGAFEYVGVPVELHYRKKPTDVANREMKMRVTLQERDGTMHVDEVVFMPRCCGRYD